MDSRSIIPVETFGTANDGTPLTWQVYAPTGSGPWKAILVVHGGGFHSQEMAPRLMEQTCLDLCAAGYIVFANQYRLAPPGSIPGQTSLGHYPDCHNDMAIAVMAARADTRTTGRVGGVGGSAGGGIVEYALATGTQDQDRLDAGISLSGPYNYAERGASPGLAAFVSDVTNFCNSTDLSVLLADSPMTMTDASVNDLFLVNSTQDTMPIQQQADMLVHLGSLGITNYQATTLPGRGHAFALWPQVKTSSLDFLSANL